MKRTLLFLHAGRTGGSTMTGALSNRFSPCDTLPLYFGPKPDLSDLDGYRFVAGHLSMSFLKLFRHQPFVLTLLRDPIDRALSSYSHMRSLPPSRGSRVLMPGCGPDAYERLAQFMQLARKCTIEELIDRAPEVAVTAFGNRQARILGGSRPEGGDERLEDAIAGLERCDFAGLSDRLDESADWLARRLGWRQLGPLPRVNVSTAQLRREEVSTAALETLAELTSIDAQLLRHAEARYERKIAEWSAAADSRDPSADISDATALGKLSFDAPIPGAGWLAREQVGDDGAFCWIGNSNRAWVELARDRRADSVVIEIPHVLDPLILETLRISVDGRDIPHSLSNSHGVIVATAPLGRRPLLRGRTTRVTLQVDRSMRPCDINPSSPDDRQLSIAVRRAALQRSR